MSQRLKESTPDLEGVMQVAKWLKLPVLLSEEEMKDLLNALEPFWIFEASRVVLPDQEEVDKSKFLTIYSDYVQSIKRSELPNRASYQPFFSSFWTADKEALYAYKVEGERRVIRAIKPVVQLQAHTFSYSKTTESFQSMVYGPDSITWGVQFSYPQLYQDPKTGDILKVGKENRFFNTQLFERLRHWVRANTVATPFTLLDRKINAPIRIGKSCFAWVNHHPQLQQQKIEVRGA